MSNIPLWRTIRIFFRTGYWWRNTGDVCKTFDSGIEKVLTRETEKKDFSGGV